MGARREASAPSQQRRLRFPASLRYKMGHPMASQNPLTARSPHESDLLRTALRRFPGGVLGGYYAPDDLQFVVKAARSAHLYDFSGREYIAYLLGSGPMVLGHAHPAVMAAVETQLGKGTTYFQLTETAIALTEKVCRADT